MTKEELITQQQLHIEELKIELLEAYDNFESIHLLLYAIGAPLNDNVLNFNREQRDYLRMIGNLIILPEKDE